MADYKVKVEMEIGLTALDIEDIIITALENGIGWWACLDNTGDLYANAPEDESTAETAARHLLSGGNIILLDDEDRKVAWELSLEKLLSGIKQFVEGGYDKYSAFQPGEMNWSGFDAVCADTIIQLALFNEVVFG